MIVAAANNQQMSSLDEDASVIETDPIPVGDANYLECTFHVPVLFTQLTSVTLTYKVQGSNDGQSWYDIAGFTDNATSPTSAPQAKGDDVTCAFVKFVFTLAGSGAPNVGISSANFDLHGNFTRK